MSRLRIEVKGIVQGVGFRFHAHRQASAFGLTGFVRNEYDGSVTIEIEGDDDTLEGFEKWCRTGPPRAEVRHYKRIVLPPAGSNSFLIL